jgi:Tol biopolymer transport system component
LRTIDIATGAVRALAPNTEVTSGGSWNADGTIVFTTRYTIDRISASGSDRRVVATLNRDFQENSLRFPRFLPDGQHFLYVARSGRAGNSGAYVGSIDGTPPVRLFAATSHVEYAPPGFLLYVRDSELVARPFDADALTVGDEIFTVVNRIEANAGGMNGQFAVSDNGVLAYLQRNTEVKAVLQWYDRAGRRLDAMGAPARHASFRLSPDGQRVLVDLASDRLVVRDVWVLSLSGAPTRVTFGESDDWQPFWSPDGTSVGFMSYRNGVGDLFVKSLDGTGAERQLLPPASEPGPDDQKIPGDWSLDGKLVAFWSERPDSRGDVWVQPVVGSQQPIAVARTPANERRPRFSPDSRFVAYESDATGTNEIFVQPVPPTGAKWQISVGGGSDVAWRASGGELYYRDRAGMLVAVPITTHTTGFTSGSPVRLFSLGDQPTAGGATRFEPTREGQRFLVRDVVPPPAQPISVLLNWQARLTRR